MAQHCKAETRGSARWCWADSNLSDMPLGKSRRPLFRSSGPPTCGQQKLFE